MVLLYSVDVRAMNSRGELTLGSAMFSVGLPVSTGIVGASVQPHALIRAIPMPQSFAIDDGCAFDDGCAVCTGTTPQLHISICERRGCRQ